MKGGDGMWRTLASWLRRRRQAAAKRRQRERFYRLLDIARDDQVAAHRQEMRMELDDIDRLIRELSERR